MKKQIEILKKIKEWIGTDGLLHFLVCYAMMLTFAPIGFGWASAITWAVAIAKEVADIIRKTNTPQQALNDIIRDAIGWGCASVVWLITTM